MCLQYNITDCTESGDLRVNFVFASVHLSLSIRYLMFYLLYVKLVLLSLFHIFVILFHIIIFVLPGKERHNTAWDRGQRNSWNEKFFILLVLRWRLLSVFFLSFVYLFAGVYSCQLSETWSLLGNSGVFNAMMERVDQEDKPKPLTWGLQMDLWQKS